MRTLAGHGSPVPMNMALMSRPTLPLHGHRMRADTRRCAGDI